MKPIVKQWFDTDEWCAYMIDFDGKRVGSTIISESRDQALFLLGLEYGRRPQAFARPLSEIAD